MASSRKPKFPIPLGGQKSSEQSETYDVLKQEDASGSFSHPVEKTQKKKHIQRRQATHPATMLGDPSIPTDYRKEIKQRGETPEAALRNACREALSEALARELYRLIIGPTHPKTRIVIDVKNKKIFVSSKEVGNFQPLYENARGIKSIDTSISNGEIPGLGEIMAMALWLREIDLKSGNVGIGIVDRIDAIVMIDADWCLLKERMGKHPVTGEELVFDITPELLECLPRINREKYGAHNWLDHIRMGKQKLTPQFVRCGKSDFFRREINRAILKILLLPEDLIETLAAHIAGEGHHPFFQEAKEDALAILKERRQQYHKTAFQNQSFQEFMKTDDAEDLKNDFLYAVNHFVMTGHFPLVEPDERGDIEEHMDNCFTFFQQTAEETSTLSIKELEAVMDPVYKKLATFGTTKERIDQTIQPVINQFKSAANDADRYDAARDYINRCVINEASVETEEFILAIALQAGLQCKIKDYLEKHIDITPSTKGSPS